MANPDSSSPKAAPQSVNRRLMRLGVALAGLWLVTYVIGPFLVENIAPFKKYAATVEETGIIPGALYYTDIPQSTDAEINNRNAIRFFTGKKAAQVKRVPSGPQP